MKNTILAKSALYLLEHPIRCVRMFPAKIRNSKKSAKFGSTNKLLFKPIILCLLFHGISINSGRSKRKMSVLFLMLVFHFFWITGTASTISCLLKMTSSFYVFSALVKIVSISLWWTLYKRRHEMYVTLRHLNRLHYEIHKRFHSSNTKPKNIRKPFHAMLTFSLLVLFVFSLIPGCNNVYNTLKQNTVLATCFHMYIPASSKTAKSCMYFAIQTNHQIVNWTVSYLATLLIIFCSLELGYLSQILIKNMEAKPNKNSPIFEKVLCHQTRTKMGGISMNQNDEKSLLDLFEKLQDTFRQFEDCFSLTCFFVLIRLFMEFFRIFSLFFNLVKGKPQSVSIINASSYACVTGTLFLAMILSADRVQNNFATIRRLATKMAKDSIEDIHVPRSEDVSLTGWGIFELKKKLILSTLASLITYGVLLQQLQQ